MNQLEYVMEVAYDGHNDEIWADIYRYTPTAHNVVTCKMLNRQLIVRKDNPSMEGIIKKTVHYLNNEHNAGIVEYETDTPSFMASYVYQLKEPVFEIEEYEKDQFRFINKLPDDIQLKMKADREARKIQPQYTILDYGHDTYNDKDLYWGVIFRTVRIADNLTVKQEVNIETFQREEGEPTLQNLLKKMLTFINTHCNAGIESYDLANPIGGSVYIYEADDAPHEIIQYDAFNIVKEVVDAETKEYILNIGRNGSVVHDSTGNDVWNRIDGAYNPNEFE